MSLAVRRALVHQRAPAASRLTVDRATGIDDLLHASASNMNAIAVMMISTPGGITHHQ